MPEDEIVLLGKQIYFEKKQLPTWCQVAALLFALCRAAETWIWELGFLLCSLCAEPWIGNQHWSQRCSSPKVKRSKHHHCFFWMNHLQFRKISRCHALQLALPGLLKWTWECEFVGSAFSAASMSVAPLWGSACLEKRAASASGPCRSNDACNFEGKRNYFFFRFCIFSDSR